MRHWFIIFDRLKWARINQSPQKVSQFTSSFQTLLKQLKLYKENIIPDCFHHDVHQQLVRCCFSLLEETISFWSQLCTSGRLTQESKITITHYLARLTQLIESITKSWFCLVLGTKHSQYPQTAECLIIPIILGQGGQDWSFVSIPSHTKW